MLHFAVTFGSLSSNNQTKAAFERPPRPFEYADSRLQNRRLQQVSSVVDLPERSISGGRRTGSHRPNPKWMFLAEDDHSIDVKGLLRTLAYFNHSHPMTMGEGKFHELPIHKDEPGHGRGAFKPSMKCHPTSKKGAGTFSILPFRNPSIWSAAALVPIGPGVLAGALRHQCQEAANTHDVTVRMKALSGLCM